MIDFSSKLLAIWHKVYCMIPRPVWRQHIKRFLLEYLAEFLLRSTILNSLFSFYFLLFSLCLPIVCFIIHLFVLCLMIFALSGRLVILSSHLRRICNTVSQLDVICLT